MMNHTTALFGGEQRRWWIVLAMLLVALACVGQVNAWYLADRDAAQRDEVTGDTSVALDSQHLYKYAGGNWMYYATSYPATDWSIYGYQGVTANHMYFYSYDSGGSGIFNVAASTGDYRLINVYRTYEGGTYKYYVYVNGAYYRVEDSVGTTPYWGRWYAASQVFAYFMIVGEDEEKNLILTHPSTYFIAKDFTNPAFSGLYSALDTSVWADRFYARYISDTSAKNITIKNKATGATIYSHATTGFSGLYQFNITEIFFNSGVPYGIYTVAMDGSTQSQDIPYMGIVTSGTSVEWDATEYGEDETATMTFSITEAYWLPDDYSYRLEIWDENLEEVTGWAVTSRPVAATKTEIITSAEYPDGEYYCVLTATDLSSLEEVLMAYDAMTVDIPGSGDVAINGTTRYALNGTAFGGSDVDITQLGVVHETTSNATTGIYSIEGLITDWSIGCNATHMGYESYVVFFTPLSEGVYTVDLSLVPVGGPQPGAWYNLMTNATSSATTTDYWNVTLNGTSLGGLIYQAPYWDIAEGAVVTLSNDTWSSSDTVGAGGWYQFDNLTQSQYDIDVSKAGFATTSGTVTPLENQFTRKDAYLEIEYTLTVNAKDLSSQGLITTETVTISASPGSYSSTTTTGSVTFTGLSYNLYDIIGTCEGYYPGMATVLVEENTTVDIYLQGKTDLSGSASNYVPHPVRFTYVDAYGNPITGASVTATALESTNPWSWLSGVFGFDTNVTDIQDTVLSGTTGHDGTLSFLMIETIQYRVNCVKASSGINHTVDIYPKESEYFIRIGALPSVGSDYPTYSLNATTTGTNVTLFGNYSDTSGSTTAALFIVTNSSGSEVYNTSITLTGGVGSASFNVNNTKGDQYTFGLVAEHSTQGTIEKWIDITLKGSGRLIDFGEGWTDFMYLVMSVACIFLVAGCFGEMDVRLGAFFIPLMGGVFWWIGWMPETYGALISIAGFLGAIYYIRSKAKELDT